MFVSTRLLKVANTRSLRPLSFVSTLQSGPQTSPQPVSLTGLLFLHIFVNYHRNPKHVVLSCYGDVELTSSMSSRA